MGCPHVATAHLSPPNAFTQVHKEECTQCFDSQDSENGIDVCLTCFNAGCNDPTRHHAQTHFLKTQHPLVLNIQRVTLDKPKRADDDTPPPQKISKLAIVPENEEEKYEHWTKVKCYACDGVEVERTTGNLPTIIDSVLASLTYTKQSEIKAWEQEIVPCDHTRHLQQSLPHKLESQSHCTRCDLTQNLWLCLVCGNLGCGRKQFGSDVGGNGHGLQHFEETRHAVSCKLGTITPEGTADIYCYTCNDERTDPHLAQHLGNWGIEVGSQLKTEKSMAELQLEQNLKFDFSMTLEDGRQLEPLFGPGYTGLKNMGNSCYMASVLQSVFALKPFQQRYLTTADDHAITCANDAATCLHCQLSKLADGLHSGRYSIPAESADDTAPQAQDGIPPAMFKALVGKDHPEFSTMRQQDAYEFFQHLVRLVEQKERANKTNGGDPTTAFNFMLQQRLQCTKCRKVRYSKQITKDISVGVPARKKNKEEEAENTEEGKEKKEEIEYEEVTFQECLDRFVADEIAPDYACPHCMDRTTAMKSIRFATFPEVLVIHARRFEYVNWVPQKISVPINVPLGDIDLEKYLGHGQQPDEELLPEDAATPSTPQEPQVDAAALEQLEGMGFPRVRCQKALLKTGNQGAELAMNWLFEHMEDPDIDDPIQPATGSRRSAPEPTADQISMLADMGFTAAQAKKALRETDNDMQRAVEWLFSHSDDVMDEDADAGTGQQAVNEVVGDATPPITFRVSSFVSHKGTSVHCGHYVAHVRKDDNQWVLFNDNKVAATPEPPIREAYMYVLERVKA